MASEVMSILSVARDLGDLRERVGRMVLALDTAAIPYCGGSKWPGP